VFAAFTYGDLRAMFYATWAQAMALTARHGDLMTAAQATPDHDVARALIATASVVLAAMTEQQELIHAIRLEICRRNAETEQHEMGLTDD
jgi:hypothetical protein